ncbi:hypothetical protein F2Q69_00030536 [Brassica cretica]|uniref:Uncharacterized protein n=1 Tax=Brassica cretica TaxID=69181 RepID=A0A8S9S1L1_BRACR|nr:hypothetical protein F2Q69_00030536 [Brassica cretica]
MESVSDLAGDFVGHFDVLGISIGVLSILETSTTLPVSPSPPRVLQFLPEGSKGPIFEDGHAFDSAYNLFHGKDSLLPLSGRSIFRDDLRDQTSLQVNPTAGKVATISLSAFGLGGPFSFGPFSDKFKKQQHKKPNKQHSGDSSKHEAVGDEWLKTGHCPTAKSYNAASKVMPLVAKALQPPHGMRFRCPAPMVAARAAF